MVHFIIVQKKIPGDPNNVNFERGSNRGTSFAERGAQLPAPPVRARHEALKQLSAAIKKIFFRKIKQISEKKFKM